MRDRKAVYLSTLLGTAAVAFCAPAAAQVQASAAGEIEEVVVTATKRPENVRDISGSVSALSGAQLDRIGAQALADYVTRIPGVVLNAGAPGNSTVVIRGVSTTTGIDQGQGTTGYFIDEVPLTDPSYAIAIPDIDAFDVDNVAVLRGPQGTLFGSASLGGAINYQTKKPDLSSFEARAQSTLETTRHGGEGGSGKLMVNLPLITDTFAVRGVFVYRQDAGYIDNLGTGEDDANHTLTRGGRVQVLWAPRDGTKVNYLFLDQSQGTHDLGYQQPVAAGALRKTTLLAETSRFQTQIHNLRFDQDTPFGVLTATATYHRKRQDSIVDSTEGLSSVLPLSPITIAQPASSSGATFEARLASPSGQKLEYVIGVMRDDTRQKIRNVVVANGASAFIEAVFAPDFGAGIGATAPDDAILTAYLPVRGVETALFGEASYHLTDKWKVTLGGRLFEQKVESRTDAGGFFTLVTSGSLNTTLSGVQREKGFAPKASITWTPNESLMAYALVSKGFRFGGPNIVTSVPGQPVPKSYDTDSLVNYELGVRADFLDRRVLVDATAFYIDWSDIQLRLQTDAGLNYATNAGKARIMGLEGSLTAVLAPRLQLASTGTVLDAELDEPFDPGGGTPIVAKGTTLPGASKWQLANTLTYDWDVGPARPTFVLAHRYISKAPGGLITGTPQGGYHLFDARAGFHFERFDVTAFVRNIADKRGVTTGSVDPLQQYVLRPRTIGVTLDVRM